MEKHEYLTTVVWTGNRGRGTADYKSYGREHLVRVDGKPDLLCSSDPAFRGDATKHNPEDLLLASLSACHMLWYLHLCADSGIVVVEYVDRATGIMLVNPDGSGRFQEVTLNPTVSITDRAATELAQALHKRANAMCFIANSMNFPVKHNPTIVVSV